MRRRGRLFLDVALPVVLYSAITIVAQFVVIFIMALIFCAAHTGGEVTDIADKALKFIEDNAILGSVFAYAIVVGVIFIDSRIRKVGIFEYTQLSKPIGYGVGVSAVLC